MANIGAVLWAVHDHRHLFHAAPDFFPESLPKQAFRYDVAARCVDWRLV
ncbi:MAG: hypothetical protein GY798_06000 [Hyphomicrobiales bacterium]|nr:hypothetical protein [Hyphomicrobiales bacterium]